MALTNTERHRRWLEKGNNRDKVREYSKEYYAKNKEKIREYMREYYKKYKLIYV